MTDLVERLRQTLGGVAREESGGDNLAILLASYFEPGIESEELDDSETWKQGAIDASNRVLDAIHAHYATELAALREQYLQSQTDLQNAIGDRDEAIKQQIKAEARAETAERELSDLTRLRDMLILCGELGGKRPGEHVLEYLRRIIDGLIDAERKLAEAREALKPFAAVAEHDISESDADTDFFWPMTRFNHAPRLEVGHLRAARAITGKD